MLADLSMQADPLREAIGKSDAARSAPRSGREGGGDQGGSIALSCRALGVSETCFRYSPKRDGQDEIIADLLAGLGNVHKSWFWPVFPAPSEGERACLEPEAGPPDRLRTEPEPAEQAIETPLVQVQSRTPRRRLKREKPEELDAPEAAEPGLVDKLHG
ncbi:hypothetical protein GCM10010991_35520 [Gemmobacter aquaticus]|uniref:Uncharacterized protein n=1 Tax=Gemmobacter aquaticus TaxID=490185 RepID=A0A917YPD8_9RHOB|nr:hypothetical protein GCM10010991_35520 [Gemmobacter aquaticus]